MQGAGSRLWQGVLFDITELKRAEERRREAEHRLRTLVEEIPAATYIYGEVEAGSGRFMTLYESPQIEVILGYPARSWDDPEFHLSIVDPRDRERVALEEARTDATGDRFLCEYRVRAADGHEVWLREEAVLADAEPAEPRRWLGVVSDVTRERGAQEEIERYSRELEEANLELRANERQLVAAMDELSRVEAERRRLLDGTVRSLERERARIAIELHDGPIQRLTALGLRLGVLRKRVASGEWSAVDESFELAQKHLGADVEYLRHLMSGLRPPSLDMHGLEAAIRDFADATCGDAGLECTVDVDIPDRLGDALETVLYRVAQEALTNVVKHARAQSVRVSLRVCRESAELEVVDDGVGLPAGPQRLDGLPHLGILGMRERIDMVGGAWEIGPGRMGGTRVHAVVPLDGGFARPADGGELDVPRPWLGGTRPGAST